MPDPPNDKLRVNTPAPPEGLGARIDDDRHLDEYVELDVATNFSFLRGASHPDELVYRAAELGYRAIGVTDLNTLAGVVRAHQAAEQAKIKLVLGSRLRFTDVPDLLVWPSDRAGYGRLCRLLTDGKRRAEKGQCTLTLDDFLKYSQGQLAALCPPAEVSPDTFIALGPLRDALGDRLSLAVSRLHQSHDPERVGQSVLASHTYDVPLVATNHVHYHDPLRRPLQDLLTCIRHGCTIHEAGYRLFSNGERYLKSPAQMVHLFRDLPQAVLRTREIAERCTFNLKQLRYEYPHELVPEGTTAIEYLTQLSWQGARERFPHGIPHHVASLIEHELKLIAELKYEAYFLTVYDMVVFARSRGILCQGRGSAANSAVCYCLGVTSVDPSRIDLLFERFVSAARNEPPDIDVDFEHERREEVIQYVYEKYGRERAGMTAEVITYRGRSAVRDVGKALGLSLDLVDQMAKRLDWWHRGTLSREHLLEVGLDPNDRTVRMVTGLSSELLGFPRHLSQHVGGMVMTRGPLCEMVPIENASMEDRTVIEWDKDDIDAVGILKVDALALGMLTAISKAFRMVEESDEATKRRSDEGVESATEGKDNGQRQQQEEGADVSGFDRGAEREGVGETGLPRDARDAEGRAVWADESDAPGGGVGSVEHRRGPCAPESDGLSSVFANFPRLARGADDATGDQLGARSLAAAYPPLRIAGRGRPNPPSPYSKPREQEQRFLNLSPSHEPSPFVASSLRRSRFQLHTIPPEDPAVYDMISDADTVGVFQIESRAQMSMLPRLQPRNFYDLVIEVAIVRPGPIQGDMVHPYLRRRCGEEPVSYPSEALRRVLEKTLGVPLFQEQAMKVAMVAAGFTADEADQLRRAMAAWKKHGALDKFHAKIVDGMLRNGYTEEFAERCFHQIKGFGEYGFPESHAASFALLVYASAWLKRYHPAAFCGALINSQPMGFYAPAQLVRDAEEHGVQVRPADVTFSEWDCLLEESTKARRHEGTEGESDEDSAENSSSLRASVPLCLRASSHWGCDGPALRLGFRLIKGFRETYAQRIVEARRMHGPFTSIDQFRRLTRLPISAMRILAEADAFDSIELSRRQSLWQTLAMSNDQAMLFEPADATSAAGDASEPPPATLPIMPLQQEVMADYATTGLSTKAHPVSLIRDALTEKKIRPTSDLNTLPHGTFVKVAGLVLIRQRPGTASGIVFATIEDESGIANLIITPDVYERFRLAARHSALLQANGYLERHGKVVHVLTKQLFNLDEMLFNSSTDLFRSRDFH